MKRTALLSSTCLVVIATFGLAGIAHAETPSGIATSVGVVTGQPPSIAAPIATSPTILKDMPKSAPGMPNMPAMPAMPKMPEMPEMPTVKMIPPTDNMVTIKPPTIPVPGTVAPPLSNSDKSAQPGTVTPSSAVLDVMKHNHLSDAMNQDKVLNNPNEKMDPSIKAFNEANSTMHQNMAVQYSGNTDVDFVKGMIPHHQGAVDMAKVVLKYGKDPEIKKFAEDIIKAQASEIEFMKKWLASHPK